MKKKSYTVYLLPLYFPRPFSQAVKCVTYIPFFLEKKIKKRYEGI